MRIEANPSRLEAFAGRLDRPLDDLRDAVADHRLALLRHLDAPNDLPTAVDDLGPRARAVLGDAGDLADLLRGFADALRHVDAAAGLDRADVAAHVWARVLGHEVALATVERLVVDVLEDRGVPTTSLTDARRHLTEHPALAADLLHGGVEMPACLRTWIDRELAATGTDQRLFVGLDPTAQGLLGLLVPDVAADDRAPFASRIGANHLLVVRAAEAIEGRLADLRAEDHDRHHDWVPFNEDDLDGRIDELQDRADLYAAILTRDRQLLLFDETGDGRIIELHGTVGPGIDHVGVLVPGTGASLGNHEHTARRSRSFVETTGDVVMVSWLGGDMPDGLVRDAPFNHYSRDDGPALAGFSHAVRREIAAMAGGADLTVIGHSYGGATVGQGELAGLDADRVLHVASAGAGAGVDAVSDYPMPDRDRYSLTDDDDPIHLTQGSGLGDRIGHGADPDRLFVQLHSGNLADGTEIDDGAHSAVFSPWSDAWGNMRAVITGGEVMLHVPPDLDVVPVPGGGGAVVVETPNEPEPLDID